MTGKITGSCLCGAVAYAATGPEHIMHHCHCRTCQKTHSSAFTTTVGVSWEPFEWTRGGDVVTFYESSPGKRRWFCPKCGSHLVADFAADKIRRLRVGCMDEGLNMKPDRHIWTSHKADWFDFDDDLPRDAEGRPDW